MLGKIKKWYTGLSTTGKTVLIAAVVGTGVAGVAMGDPDATSKASVEKNTSQSNAQRIEVGEKAQAVEPKIEKKTVTETAEVAFAKTTTDDPMLEKGLTKVQTAGVPGVKTFIYEVTLTDGVESQKNLLKEEVTKQPVTEVTAIGTKAKQACSSNYSGACVPIASDVDCAGGTGDGPAYVQGPVYVVGNDIYGLDRDGNGVACQ
jgi:resuscitation-promoting factor RpfB